MAGTNDTQPICVPTIVIYRELRNVEDRNNFKKELRSYRFTNKTVTMKLIEIKKCNGVESKEIRHWSTLFAPIIPSCVSNDKSKLTAEIIAMPKTDNLIENDVTFLFDKN